MPLPPVSLDTAREAARAWGHAMRAAQTLEILPPGVLDSHWELAGPALGISKPFLLAVYVAMAADHYKDPPSAPPYQTQLNLNQLKLGLQIDHSLGDQLANFSLVGLMATTENVTVLNMRKRLVTAGAVAPDLEMHTLDVLLGSPLPNHNKSPLLWAHRRWVQTHYAPVASLAAELELVAAAGTRHPKNYYAWNHARWVVASTRSSPAADLDPAAWAWQLCQQHVTDISMWTFLAVVGPEHYADACELHERYPHPAQETYLKLVDASHGNPELPP